MIVAPPKMKVLATATQDMGALHPLAHELGQRFARLDVEIAEFGKIMRRPSKDARGSALPQA